MSELPLDLPAKPRRAVRKKPLTIPQDTVAASPAERAADHTPKVPLRSTGLDPLTLWFVAAVSLGTLLHLLSAAPWPAVRLIGWAAPLIISLAYPAFGLSQGWHRSAASREKFADNSYYLGFIFTQVALVIGFVPMTFFNAELGSQDVLRAFSVALGASLIGLVVRTMLVQTGHSVTGNADIIENEVEALAIAVSQQTRSIIDEFSRLGGRLTNTYGELNSELEACVGRLSATFARYENAVGRDIKIVGAAAEGIVETSRQVQTNVQNGASKVAAQAEQSAELLNAARDKLRVDLEDAIRTLHQTNSALAASANALAVVPDLGGALETLSERVGTAGEFVGRFETLAVRSEQALQDAARQNISSLDDAAAREREGLSARAMAFQNEVETAAQSLEKTLERFRAELSRIRG